MIGNNSPCFICSAQCAITTTKCKGIRSKHNSGKISCVKTELCVLFQGQLFYISTRGSNHVGSEPLFWSKLQHCVYILQKTLSWNKYLASQLPKFLSLQVSPGTLLPINTHKHRERERGIYTHTHTQRHKVKTILPTLSWKWSQAGESK